MKSLVFALVLLAVIVVVGRQVLTPVKAVAQQMAAIGR